MNKIKFENYKSQRMKSDGLPIISIIGKGGFGFSSSFLNKYEPNKPKYVGLKYAQDMDYIYIGFVFSNEKKDSYLKIHYPKSTNGLVIATGFFNLYKINAEKYRDRYTAEEYSEDDPSKIYMIKVKK